MAVAGPFYFAWVDPTETTFGVEHHRMDEYIFSIRRTVSEGQKPLVEIEMQNPHVGLLAATRKQWAWFAWDRGYFTGVTGDGIEPLFFGHVVGVPTQIFEEVIQVQFVASPQDYKQRVQRVAEPMKVLPWVDPVWVDVTKRDDPDTILEAYAKFWDVDPITHEVTAVSIIEGPDGNVDLDGTHFYDTMTMSVSQPPATSILMDATVSWTQTSRGVVDLGSKIIPTPDGSIVDAWPKPLQQIGGGWSVFYGDAQDTLYAQDAYTISWSASYQNNEKTHEDGDTMSASWSATEPVGSVWASVVISEVSQTGIVDPFAVDGDGDPSPLNLPATYNSTTMYVMGSRISGSMTLQYVAERPRTERVIFAINADTQEVIVNPTLDQNSEVLTMSGADVGTPILDLLNWSSIAGLAVVVGQVIFPDNPSTPGGRSIQIATVAGTAGETEPNFSDVPGDTTIDNTVTWSSLGAASPPDNARDWTAVSYVNAGTIIRPKYQFYVTYALLTAPGRRSHNQSLVAVHEGQIIKASNGSYQVCTLGGETSLTEPAFSTTWGVTTLSGSATWTSLGTHLPSGTTYQLCTTAGITGSLYVIPPFSETLHATTTDGAAVWTCIGTGVIPIGGAPGDVTSPSYFTKDRGLRSLEHLALLVRAKLLYRARCVEISFDDNFVTGVDLSTRKTITLHDPRIAGGVALGKIKSVDITASESGTLCHVTIACLVGKETAVTGADGEPTYVDEDYVESDYQIYENNIVLLPSGTDVSYTPPVYQVTDDGLVFPLTYDQVVLVNEIRGNTTAQMNAIQAALSSLQTQQQGNTGTNPFAFSLPPTPNIQSITAAVKAHQVWLELQLKPVNPGSFHAVYNVKFSDLHMAKGIDLEAEVTS